MYNCMASPLHNWGFQLHPLTNINNWILKLSSHQTNGVEPHSKTLLPERRYCFRSPECLFMMGKCSRICWEIEISCAFLDQVIDDIELPLEIIETSLSIQSYDDGLSSIWGHLQWIRKNYMLSVHSKSLRKLMKSNRNKYSIRRLEILHGGGAWCKLDGQQ